MMNLCLADLLFFIDLEQSEVFEEFDCFCFGEGRLRDFIEVSFPEFIGDSVGNDDTWRQVSEDDIRFDHSIGPFGVPRLAPREGIKILRAGPLGFCIVVAGLTALVTRMNQ